MTDHNSNTIQFAATPIAIRSESQRSFNIGKGPNGPRSVYLDKKAVWEPQPLPRPINGGTHWVTITRKAARQKGIKDER